jgi:type VI secretion system secreted protein VgrG
MPSFGRDPADQRHVLHFEGDREAVALDQPYQFSLEDGSLVKGVTSNDGGTEKLAREAMELARLAVTGVLLNSGASGTGDSHGPVASSEPDTTTALLYDQTFLIEDDRSGQPLSGVRYRIELASGEVVIGISDENGHSQTVTSDTPQSARITVPYHDYIPQPDAHIGPDACGC